MSGKKINPRRQPRTEDDVQKAYKRGRSEAIEFALAVSCLAVHDVFSPTQEQMEAFHAKHTANVTAIVKGEVKYQDILDALDAEYGLEIEYK